MKYEKNEQDWNFIEKLFKDLSIKLKIRKTITEKKR